MENITWHRHHIVPKHAGGTDDPSNLLKCNVAMHAFMHEQRYRELGDKYDKYAAQMLRREITVGKARQLSAIEGSRRYYAENPEKRIEHASAGGKAVQEKYPETKIRWNKAGIEASKEYWEVTHPDSTVEIIHGLEKFCKEHNLSQGNLSHRGHSKGFKVKEIKNGK